MSKSHHIRLKVKANIELADGTIETLTLNSKRDAVKTLSRYAENETNKPRSVELVVEPRFPESIRMEYGDLLITERLLHCYDVDTWFDMLECAFKAQTAAELIEKAMNEEEPVALIEARLPVADIPSILGGGRAENLAKEEIERAFRNRGIAAMSLYEVIEDNGDLVVKALAPDNPIVAASVVRDMAESVGLDLKDDPGVTVISLDAVSLCTDIQEENRATFKVKVKRPLIVDHLDEALCNHSTPGRTVSL